MVSFQLENRNNIFFSVINLFIEMNEYTTVSRLSTTSGLLINIQKKKKKNFN